MKTQEAKKFVEFWTFQRGSEKGEDQTFWNSLLSDVLGVADTKSFIQYQVPVHFKGTTKFINVSINQFYGIEINDFAVTVAQTAMWIAECKMMQETNALLAKNFTPLPLTDSAKIAEGNALKMDWGELISRETRSARDSRAQVDAGVLVGHEHYGADGRAASMRSPHERRIFNADGTCVNAKNISPYLIDAPTAFVEKTCGHEMGDIVMAGLGATRSNATFSERAGEVLCVV